MKTQRPITVVKRVDTGAPAHGSISPELRAYLVERRRALLTELNELDKLLGTKTK